MGGSKNNYAPLGATLELLTELVQEDMLKKWSINFNPDDILFYEVSDLVLDSVQRTSGEISPQILFLQEQ